MQSDATTALAILGLALLLDFVAGEYPATLHPVVWIGTAIAAGLRLAPTRGWWRQFIFGALLTFLIVALKRFLANEWDRSRAQKRGGGKIHLPLDTSTAETRYQIEPAAEPDKTYERRWALTQLCGSEG